MAGDRQGPWRAQAPPGWVQGPRAKEAPFPPSAPRHSSLCTSTHLATNTLINCCLQRPGSQMSAATTAAGQLPPAPHGSGTEVHTPHSASPHRPRPPSPLVLWPHVQP